MVFGPRTAGALALLLAAAAPAGAEAFRCKISDKYSFVSLRWPQRVIPFGVRAGTAADLGDIDSAFSEWSGKSCTDLAFEYVGVVSAEDPVSQVVFVGEGWALGGRPDDAVAVTLTTYGRSTGLIRSASIEVNADLYVFTDVTEGCALDPPPYDLIAVLTHEVGHFIGLDHTEQFSGAPSDPTMAPRVGECEADKRSLEPDDIAALCLLYPRGQPAGACAPLPSQPEPYVVSRAFGCSALGRGSSGGLLPAVLLALLAVARPRKRANRRAYLL